MFRIMRLHARRHPHVRRTCDDNISGNKGGSIEISAELLRTSWGRKRQAADVRRQQNRSILWRLRS